MTASWTDEQIRAATPFPKPLGAIDAEWNREADRCFAHVDVTPPERKLLQHIAEYADEVVVARSIHHDNWAAIWLLVPMPAHLLALLHNFEAQIEDLEEDADREPEAFDNNDAIEDESGGDDEPSLGATMAIDQRDAGWRDDGQAASLTDLELDVADDEQNGDLEKSSGDEEP